MNSMGGNQASREERVNQVGAWGAVPDLRHSTRLGTASFFWFHFIFLSFFFLSFSFERLKSWNQSWVDLAREGGEGRFFSGDWQTSMLDACQENGRFCPISMVRYIFLLAWLCSLVVVAVALPLRSMPSSYCLSSFCLGSVLLSFFLSFLGRFTLNVCHGCSNQRQGCKDADPHRLILIDSAEWPDRWLSLSDWD